MKKMIRICVVSIIAFTECTSSTRIMSSAEFSGIPLAPITKEQYSILQDVDGTGMATSVLFFGSANCMKRAEDAAKYQAIGKIPGADMLIAPRYEVEQSTFLFFYKRITVKVKAKAVQLKTQ